MKETQLRRLSKLQRKGPELNTPEAFIVFYRQVDADAAGKFSEQDAYSFKNINDHFIF